MAHSTVSAASPWAPTDNQTTFEDGMQLRIAALIDERENLLEEVRQLRAAVRIYTEVVRRLQLERPRRAA